MYTKNKTAKGKNKVSDVQKVEVTRVAGTNIRVRLADPNVWDIEFESFRAFVDTFGLSFNRD